MKRDDEFKNAVLDSVALRPGLLLGAAGKGLARQVLSKSEQAAQIGLHHFSPRTAPESEQGLEVTILVPPYRCVIVSLRISPAFLSRIGGILPHERMQEPFVH